MKPHKRNGRAALHKRREAAAIRGAKDVCIEHGVNINNAHHRAKYHLDEDYILIPDNYPGPVYIENAILSGEAARVDGGYVIRRKKTDK